MSNGSGKRCTQCGDGLNPVAAIMSPVCGSCTRRNHESVTDPGRDRDPKRGDVVESTVTGRTGTVVGRIPSRGAVNVDWGADSWNGKPASRRSVVPVDRVRIVETKS